MSFAATDVPEAADGIGSCLIAFVSSKVADCQRKSYAAVGSNVENVLIDATFRVNIPFISRSLLQYY
jgi:hypothetical protein